MRNALSRLTRRRASRTSRGPRRLADGWHPLVCVETDARPDASHPARSPGACPSRGAGSLLRSPAPLGPSLSLFSLYFTGRPPPAPPRRSHAGPPRPLLRLQAPSARVTRAFKRGQRQCSRSRAGIRGTGLARRRARSDRIRAARHLCPQRESGGAPARFFQAPCLDPWGREQQWPSRCCFFSSVASPVPCGPVSLGPARKRQARNSCRLPES